MVVSIIVPIYNSEKYLSRCINSILSQKYSDIEVILVNDGSQDGSALICENYSTVDDRVIVINQENKGLGGARNSGLKIAKGTYIAFIDADDSIDYEMVGDFVTIATQEYPDVICSNLMVYEDGNIKYNLVRNEIEYGTTLSKEAIKNNFLQPYYGSFMGIIPSACTKMYKKSFLIENNLFFDEILRRAQDYWFNFDAFKNAKTVYAIDKAYYHYYKNVGSMIRSYRSNVFEMYVANRRRLIVENKELNLIINWPVLNLRFFDDANEYILLCIKAKGFIKSYDVTLNILKNEEFQNVYLKVAHSRMHTRIIKKLLKIKAYLLIHLVYIVWSAKLT